MEFSGEQLFKASREQVWEALMDPAALRASIPGCEQLDELAPGSYRLSVRLGLVPVKGSYSGTVTVADAFRPESYRLVGAGDGAPGKAQGNVRLTLNEVGDGTSVRYVAELQAQGGLARLGGPLIAGTAKIIAGQFFRAMERYVAERTV